MLVSCPQEELRQPPTFAHPFCWWWECYGYRCTAHCTQMGEETPAGPFRHTWDGGLLAVHGPGAAGPQVHAPQQVMPHFQRGIFSYLQTRVSLHVYTCMKSNWCVSGLPLFYDDYRPVRWLSFPKNNERFKSAASLSRLQLSNNTLNCNLFGVSLLCRLKFCLQEANIDTSRRKNYQISASIKST